MKSKAAIYIRVSTTDQAESGYSLQAQESLCRQYCAEHDYAVVGVYADEGKSASKALDKRTELLRLIGDAEKGKVSVILFKDITRWTRNAAAYYKVQERLDTTGHVQLTSEMQEVYKTVGGIPHLDGQYTVFGEVTEGLDVVDRIQQSATDPNDRPLEDIRILRATVIKEP
jgi:hypothetical protein